MVALTVGAYVVPVVKSEPPVAALYQFSVPAPVADKLATPLVQTEAPVTVGKPVFEIVIATGVEATGVPAEQDTKH